MAPQMPQEIFDVICQRIGPNITMTMATYLGCNERYENLLWRLIFCKDDWINRAYELGANPALICRNLAPMSDDGAGVCSVLLMTHDWQGDTQYHKQLLFQSLRRDHSYDSERHVVTLPQMALKASNGIWCRFPRIVLYLQEAVQNSNTIRFPPNILRSFFQANSIQTQYCFARERKIRTIHSSNIIRLGDELANSATTIPVCVLILPEEREKVYLLLEDGCPEVATVFGQNGAIQGWKAR